jgi:hypothetical protein
MRLATVLVLLSACLLGGCAVVAVGSTAVSVAASGVGLAADAAVGTARLTGKAVGAAVDLALPSNNN